MLTKKIDSLQHPFVKHWSLLRSERAYREEKKRLLLMGEKTIRELSQKIQIETLITLESAPAIAAQDRYLVSDSILKKITGLSAPDGFAAEVALPPPQDLTGRKHLLILDELSDPGNLGTLLRTALAFRWDGVILTPNTVDLFNDKALRASKGAPFYLPYARLTPQEILPILEKRSLFLADLKGEKLDQLAFKAPLALILSHEAKGPSSWSKSLAKKVTIPMSPLVESLNVAVSGAILLYTMRPQ